MKTSSGGGGGAGNVTNKNSDSVVVGGGHGIEHHARGPVDVIGLTAARNGVVASLASHYDHYLPPPSASQILAAEEQRRARERIIMADRELEGDQLRMQHHHQQQQQQHQHREREKELDRMRHLEQQRAAASYYGQQANVSIADPSRNTCRERERESS